MAGSITIIGGHTGNTLTGLVTVPVDLSDTVTSSLQTLLGLAGLSGSVLGGQVFLNNINAVAAATVGAIAANPDTVPGLVELTNTYSNGSVLGGSVSGASLIPANYSTLVVQAPGTETITGNGSSGFLALFGDQSSVTFNSGGGSGTVVAAGAGDYVGVTGTVWSVLGSSAGNDTVNTTADSLIAAVYGTGSATGNALDTASAPSNVVGLAALNATVSSHGTNDLIASFGGSDVVSVFGSANVLLAGGADTIYAASTSTAVKAFFSSAIAGGTIDFINNSTVAASVTGSSSNLAAAGSVTVFGGEGGGYYQGGSGGNNSLIGGTGNTTLIGAGVGNILSVSAGSNFLEAASNGYSTLVASAGTSGNTFVGSGVASIFSGGSGVQAYFVGASGVETITGSSAASENRYLFLQDTTGSGTDNIIGFTYGKDHIYINPNGYTTLSGVSIAAFQTYQGAGGGTIVQLNDGTQIRLIGVTLTGGQETSLTGGTYI
jgi:hypothetical protein